MVRFEAAPISTTGYFDGKTMCEAEQSGIEYVSGWLQLKLTTGLVSDLFVRELAQCQADIRNVHQRFRRWQQDFGEWHQQNLTAAHGVPDTLLRDAFAECKAQCNVTRMVDIFRVLDEIGSLEGAEYSRTTNTKQAAAFVRKPLIGLMHKHYTDANHTMKNLENHLNRNKSEFIEFIQSEILGGLPEVPITEDVCGRIAHYCTIRAYEKRNARHEMTGEFIVYKCRDGINHYLTLGVHGEWEQIAERVKSCAAQFPYLNL